jgi:hypothetical protein
MAGARTIGPVGLYGEIPPQPQGPGAGAGSCLSGPLGLGDVVASQESARGIDVSAALSSGIGLRLGARQYRILAEGAGRRSDERLLGEEQTSALLAEAARLEGDSGGERGAMSALLAELRRSGRRFVVVEVRAQAPIATASVSAPSPAPAPPAPARKPAPVKEGWIEIEVLDDAGEPREGDRYKLKLPDGRLLEGTIGSKGLISVHGIDPGNAELTITTLDSALWSA